jgi:hypothetical protein
VGDPVRADQPGGNIAVELSEADDMRTAGNRRHCRGIAERAAERHCCEERRAGRIEAHAAGDIGSVSGDCLLIVQDELWPAGRTGGGESQAWRFARRLVRSGIERVTVERQHRQAGEFGHHGRTLKPDYATQRGAILRGEGGEDRGKIDRRESPFGHQCDRTRAAQEVADFRCAETRVDVHCECAEPGTGKDRGEISGAVRQPQRHACARTDPRRAQPRRSLQHALVEGAAAQRACGIRYRRRRRIERGPRHQRAQRARVSRSIGSAHQKTLSTRINTTLQRSRAMSSPAADHRGSCKVIGSSRRIK